MQDKSVNSIADPGVAMSRQGIEKHLTILEEAGLVVSERRGKYKVLRLDPSPLRQAVKPWVQAMTGNRPERR